MIRALAEWLTRPWVARVVVALAAAIAVGGAVLATQVDHDDDVLAFLPEDDPDVLTFREINRAFGGLDVAVVGIEVDNPLDPEWFAKLRDLTQVLNDASEVKFALSLANVSDFRPSADGGIETDLLVRTVPSDVDGQRALRQKVMSRDLVVGQLIAPGGKAVILYAFAAFDGDQRAFAARVRDEVLQRFPTRSVYLGGAPFVSTYIYDSTQADLRKLTPWAVVVIILLVFAAFRDVRGVFLALAAPVFGIVVALALMVATQQRYNIVLSSMPVILFSVGSAYGIHVLARYYALAAEMPPREALVAALTEVGPTVVAAGGTTMAGLLSFVTMDIQPLRSFGVFTALGIGAALVSALTFVPAMVTVFGIRGFRRPPSEGGALTALSEALQKRRGWAWAALLAVAVTGAWFTARVDTRMDQSAFFADESPPARADRFLRQHFGGAIFIQVHALGDFSLPAVLRRWSALADRLEALPDVSTVQHIGQVVAQLNAALAGERRVPNTQPQVRLLYRFMEGMPALEQLVTTERDQAVMHIKVRTNDLDRIDATLAEVERLTATVWPGRMRVVAGGPEAKRWLVDYIAGRIETFARRADVPMTGDDVERVRVSLAAPAPEPDPESVRRRLRDHLLSPEALVDLGGDRERADEVAGALLLADPEMRSKRLRASVGDDPAIIDDLLYTMEMRRPEAELRATAEARLARLMKDGLRFPGGAAKARLASRLRDEMTVLDAPDAEVAVASDEGSVRVTAAVSGLPVLHRGLSRSARRNQLLSLAVAMAAVIFVLCLLFRSVWLGLVAAVPTVCTLAVVYGTMGAWGVHLDIGTSMLASLIIGAGVDYAVHLVAAYRAAIKDEQPAPLSVAVAATGTAIWTNALMVAAGFYLLTLGEARTLQNVGGLTAAAMVVAAVSTFGAVPALLPRPENSGPPDVG